MTTKHLQIATFAPILLIQQYYGQLASLNKKIEAREDSFPTKEEATIMTRISSVIRTIRPQKKSFGETLALFTGFAEAIAQKDPALAEKLALHVQDYICTLAATETGEALTKETPGYSNASPAEAFSAKVGGANGVQQDAANPLKPFIANDLTGNSTPQRENEKWGEPTRTAPPPRNRAERREQERLQKKAARKVGKTIV